MINDKSIKPNIFLFKNLSNEDHFTNSLGYILNLFPIELGDRFVSRLAILSGFSSDYFGDFDEARFTGHHLQNEDSTSKPDLIIYTTQTKIFFEVKLKAPLSKEQLERHFIDVDRANGYLLLISNVTSLISENLLKRKNYLKPQNHSHFYWAQFETIFDLQSRKKNLSNLLLDDFKKSLRTNGIKGKQIVGATGNLYTNGSDAENLVLDKLKVILKEIGFKAWRNKNEFTLRVNVEKSGKNPLLNPRIYSSGEWCKENWIDECMIVICFADPNKKDEIKLLNKLKTLTFEFPIIKLSDSLSEKYRYYIYIPLEFVPNINSYNLDWAYLKKIWEKIYNILQSK